MWPVDQSTSRVQPISGCGKRHMPPVGGYPIAPRCNTNDFPGIGHHSALPVCRVRRKLCYRLFSGAWLDAHGKPIAVVGRTYFDHPATQNLDCRLIKAIGGRQSAPVGQDIETAEPAIWMTDDQNSALLSGHRFGDAYALKLLGTGQGAFDAISFAALRGLGATICAASTKCQAGKAGREDENALFHDPEAITRPAFSP